jgi:hypothetical protein
MGRNPVHDSRPGLSRIHDRDGPDDRVRGLEAVDDPLGAHLLVRMPTPGGGLGMPGNYARAIPQLEALEKMLPLQ